MGLTYNYSKLLFLSIVLCFLGQVVHAQHRPFFSFDDDINHLALESDLPGGFEPIFPDTTVHVLFNPARAISYGQNFTYASVFNDRSGGEENPDVRYIGLFGERSDKKWLVTFANDIRNGDSELENETFRQTNTEDIDSRHDRIFIRNSMKESSRLQFFDNDDLFISAGLNRIVKRSNNDRSIGIRFSYISNFDRRRRDEMKNEEFEQSLIREDTLVEDDVDTFKLSSISNTSNDTDILRVDLSQTIYSPTIEFINRISYQYGSDDISHQREISRENEAVDRQVRSDTTIIITRLSRLEERQLFKSNHGSHFISYQGYMGKSLSLITPDDYFFADVRAGAGFGDITGRVENFLDRETFINNQINSEDTTNFDDSIDENGNHYFADAKIGYAVRKNWKKLYAYAGISPSFHYQKSDTESLLTTPSILQMEEERYDIRAIIPVLVQYRPKKWVDFYTFVNWGYRYQRIEQISNQLLPNIDSGSFIGDLPSEFRSINKTKSSDLDTFSNFTFASTIKHPTGIRAQIAFLGDFANFNRWNFSLGYHF